MRIYSAVAACSTTSLALLAGHRSHAERQPLTAQRFLLTTSSSGSVDLNGTFLTFPTDTTSDAADYISPSIEQELIEALETDDQVTVVGDIQVGVLDCDSLEVVEDATTLQVAISPTEVIVAERTSYTYLSGDAFNDGMARKVWVGQELVDKSLNPKRTVTIAWGEVCDAESFLLKVTNTEMEGGAFSVVKSIPCIAGASFDICVVETEVLPEEDDTETVLAVTDAPVRRRTLGQATGLRSAAANDIATDTGRVFRAKRKLETTTTIDVMYLYTEGGKDVLGGISDTQMQTTLATALATSNQAINNSAIDLTLSLVYTGLLPYEEDSTSSSTVLENLSTDDDVADLRDTYTADLVQVAANLGISCGRGSLFSGNSSDGFSAVNPLCIDYFSHTHEMAHNLGCYHDRDNSDAQTDYAHGYRYCSSTDPYRTIMSYPCTNDYSVDRVNWFSNPDVVLLDKPTGTDDNDCARAIEDNMVTVSEFQPVVEVAEDVNPCFDSTNTDEYRCSGRNDSKTIDLNRCELTDSEANLLRACFEVVNVTAITKIKLNVNSFTSLPYDLFDDIDALATLNLKSNCGLTCVPPVPSDTSVLLSTCSSDIDTCDS